MKILFNSGSTSSTSTRFKIPKQVTYVAVGLGPTDYIEFEAVLLQGTQPALAHGVCVPSNTTALTESVTGATTLMCCDGVSAIQLSAVNPVIVMDAPQETWIRAVYTGPNLGAFELRMENTNTLNVSDAQRGCCQPGVGGGTASSYVSFETAPTPLCFTIAGGGLESWLTYFLVQGDPTILGNITRTQHWTNGVVDQTVVPTGTMSLGECCKEVVLSPLPAYIKTESVTDGRLTYRTVEAITTKLCNGSAEIELFEVDGTLVTLAGNETWSLGEQNVNLELISDQTRWTYHAGWVVFNAPSTLKRSAIIAIERKFGGLGAGYIQTFPTVAPVVVSWPNYGTVWGLGSYVTPVQTTPYAIGVTGTTETSVILPVIGGFYANARSLTLICTQGAVEYSVDSGTTWIAIAQGTRTWNAINGGELVTSAMRFRGTLGTSMYELVYEV